MTDRRTFLKVVAGAAILAAPTILRGRHQVFANSRTEFSNRTITLIRETLVIDMLNQFLYRFDLRDREDGWIDNRVPFTHSDWQRFKDTGITAIGFGNAASNFEDGVRLFSRWNGFIDRYPEWLARISRISDFAAVRQNGRYGVLLNCQDGSHFRKADDVNLFHGLGQRMSQLTYNGQNELASGAMVDEDRGLSVLGGEIVERMNDVGMALDIAHASDRTKRDILAHSRHPVLLSHGNCRALNPQHPRTIADEDIRVLARSGGVMGIAFIANMLKDKPSEEVTANDVVDHIDHVGRLVGLEHVGIGSDGGLESHDHAPPAAQEKFWSMVSPRYRQRGKREVAVGLDGQMKIFALTEALVRRGYTDAHIRLILGVNWERVLGTIWLDAKPIGAVPVTAPA